MHPHLHNKIKRFLTQPDQSRQNNQTKFKKPTLKEFKLSIKDGGQNTNELKIPYFDEKYQIISKNQVILPHSIKRNKQRHALVRLPELINQNIQNLQEQQKNPVFKRSNPLYVVNSLFQIMKEDMSQQNATLSHSKSNQHSRKDPSKIIPTPNKNEFNEFQVKSIKMQRAPRLLDNQINRLTQQSIFSRRRIYSQEKSRAKCQKNVQLITFYNCKQKSLLNKNNTESIQFDYLKIS